MMTVLMSDDDDDDNAACTDDVDASLSCALLWKSVFDMMSHLLQSSGQDAYIALSSPLVNHWKLFSGIISCADIKARRVFI